MIPYARILTRVYIYPVIRTIDRSIVNDNELPLGKRLSKNAVDRLGDKMMAIERRNDNRKERLCWQANIEDHASFSKPIRSSLRRNSSDSRFVNCGDGAGTAPAKHSTVIGWEIMLASNSTSLLESDTASNQ